MLGRKNYDSLQEQLINLKENLSTIIQEVATSQQKILSNVNELCDVPTKLNQYREYLSPLEMNDFVTDNRLNEIKATVDKAIRYKPDELLALLPQVDDLLSKLCSESALELRSQLQLFENLKFLVIRAIKDTLNCFYSEMLDKKDIMIASLINGANSSHKIFHQLEGNADQYPMTVLKDDAPQIDKIFSCIVRTKYEMQEFFSLKLKRPNLLKYRSIFFNEETKKLELSFSDELDKMSLSSLMECANQVIWETAKAGLKNSHRLFEALNDRLVGDKNFRDYLRCEKWMRTGGYYYLTIAPEAQHLAEEKSVFQRFLNQSREVDSLLITSEQKMMVVEVELEKYAHIEKKIKLLGNDLLEEADSLAQVNQHMGKKFPLSDLPDLSKLTVGVDSVALKKENTTSPIKSKSEHDTLLEMLQFVLSDASVKHCWSQQVKVTWGWNERVASYAVPTAIFRARTELDKLPVNLANVCQQFKERIVSGHAPIQTPTQKVYRAFASFLEGDNLVVTKEKLFELKKVLLDSKLNFNGTCLGTDLAIEAIVPAPRGLR